MSQTAISFGMYEEVRDYAELLDNILINVNDSAQHDLTESNQNLSQFLAEVGDSATSNLTARYIGLILNQKNQNLRRNLVSVGRKMGNRSTESLNSKEIKILEDFARFLEGEQIEAAARIRGLR